MSDKKKEKIEAKSSNTYFFAAEERDDYVKNQTHGEQSRCGNIEGQGQPGDFQWGASRDARDILAEKRWHTIAA